MSPAHDQQRELLSQTGIAELAGVTVAAVGNWRTRHSDTFPRPVRGDLYDRAEVEAWLRRHRPGTGGRAHTDPLWRATNLLRGEIDIMAGAGVLATMTTIGSLTGRVPGAGRLDEVAAQLEAGGAVPEGALTMPAAAARGIDPRSLDGIAEILDGHLHGSDPAEVFETIVASIGRDWAYAYTPARLAQFLISLAPPQAASVLDPACGLGTLFLQAHRTLPAAALTGCEIDPNTWALGVQRQLLHSTGAQIVRGDFFGTDLGRFDLVLANPPAGLRVGEGSAAGELLARHGASRRAAGDLAWLLAARDALAEGGTAIVATMAGVGFAGGSTRALRHELLRSGSVAAVIALPGGMLDSTALPVLVWVLTRPGPPQPVLLVNAAGAGNSPKQHVLDDAASQFRAWRDDPDGYRPMPGVTAAVPVLDLLSGEVNISPTQWTERPPDPAQALDSATAALRHLHAAQRSVARIPLDPVPLAFHEPPRHVSLQDLSARGDLLVLRPRHTNRADLQDEGPHPYASGLDGQRLAVRGYLHDLPDTAVVTEPGDVVLATIGDVRAVVDHDGGHVLGGSLWLIRTLSDDPRLRPELLALLLSSPRIAGQAVGTTVQRLRHPKDVTVPMLNPRQAPAAEELADTLAQLRQRAEELAELTATATRDLAAALDAGAAPDTGGAR